MLNLPSSLIRLLKNKFNFHDLVFDLNIKIIPYFILKWIR